MLEFFSGYLTNTLNALDYGAIIILMTIESSFIPFPSEVIIPPAGWLAAKGELNLWLVIGSGVLGSLLGGLFNYYFALILGRRVLYKLAASRWAKFFLINEDKLKYSEEYFREHGRSSTFIGRLVPAVRQLISLPAGLARMPLGTFILYTTAGAGLWSTILALLGYFFGANQEKLKSYYHLISIIGGSLFVIFVIYLIIRYRKKIRRKL
jgi:membrane protein DedA with SNARE-associated domain